jgi:mono/diheme cytochrome c family protein
MTLAIWLALWSADPVSYSRDAARIFAFHCNRCHGNQWMGTAAGLSTMTYADFMKGGAMGPPVKPGDPDGSLLMEFLDGRRGPARRMPLNAPPLGDADAGTIRRWIAEGARQDQARPEPMLHVARFQVKASVPLRIVAQSPVEAYLVLTIRGKGRILREEGAVRQGEWNLRPEPGWPKRIAIDLRLEHTGGAPGGARLRVSQGDRVQERSLP